MALAEEIVALLGDEGYRVNESIRSALQEFLTVVEEENENYDDDLDDDPEGSLDEDYE